MQVMRALVQPPFKNGFVACAAGGSVGVSPKVVIPRPKGSLVQIPRFSEAEITRQVEYYTGEGMLATKTEPYTAKVAYFLTQGNAAELRKRARMLCGY